MKAVLRSVLVLLCFAAATASTCVAAENSISALAAQILDAATGRADRVALIAANPGKSAELIAAMTEKLPVGTDDEYKAIPWIWQVAIAAGKRNDADELKKLLRVAVPKVGEPLRDWQAVVIGGGVINGLTLQGVWPRERLEELLRGDKDLQSRWLALLDSASAMADNAKVRNGTRYDALRILGVDTWERRGVQIKKYLAKGTNAELQQGAVSALGDVRSNEASTALIQAFKDLTPKNQQFAFDGLLRDETRIVALLDAMEKGEINSADLSADARSRLKKLQQEPLRQRAEKVLK